MTDPDKDRPFEFLLPRPRGAKPHLRAISAVRSSYTTPAGFHYLDDLFDMVGTHVDWLEFPAGSFALLPGDVLRELIDLCHLHGVLVASDGPITRLLAYDEGTLDRYIAESCDRGFDIVKFSCGPGSPPEPLLALTEKIRKAGLKVAAGIEVHRSMAPSSAPPTEAGQRAPRLALSLARRFLDAGASMIRLESADLVQGTASRWQSELVTGFAGELGIERVMFDATQPHAFGWYMQQLGGDVNLLIDHSQAIQLALAREGL